MGKYTMIADTGQRLVEILQQGMVPQVIQNPNEIGLRSPEDHGDVSLGLYLYAVDECEEVRQSGAAIVRNDRISRPPIYLTLYYMITAYSSGDLQYRLAQEEQILGRAVQILHDHPVIPLREVDTDHGIGMDLHVMMLRLTADERAQIWGFPNVGMRLSLFYKVTPIAIDSTVSEKVNRVRELDFNVDHNDGR
jgi:hypothetical protein